MVHPRHPSSNYPCKYLAGGVVAWKLVIALEEERTNRKIDLSTIRSLRNYLGRDLIALATVCDLMPLNHENRSIVKNGLAMMKTSKRAGLKSLAQVSGLDLGKISTYELGFQYGPRLNAAGRLDDALEAVRLFSSENNVKTTNLAQKLDRLNKKRQMLTQKYFTIAKRKAISLSPKSKIIVNADQG